MIEYCISNVPFFVIINGSICGYFQSSIGLRQGCPLSPALFSIIIDLLSSLLDMEVHKRIFSLIHSMNGLAIFHLFFFANDVFVFGKDTRDTDVFLRKKFASSFFLRRSHGIY